MDPDVLGVFLIGCSQAKSNRGHNEAFVHDRKNGPHKISAPDIAVPLKTPGNRLDGHRHAGRDWKWRSLCSPIIPESLTRSRRNTRRDQLHHCNINTQKALLSPGKTRDDHESVPRTSASHWKMRRRPAGFLGKVNTHTTPLYIHYIYSVSVSKGLTNTHRLHEL